MEADLDLYPRRLTNDPISPRTYRNTMIPMEYNQPNQPTVLLPRIVRPVALRAPNVPNLPNLPNLPRIVPINSNRSVAVPIARPTTPVRVQPVRTIPIRPASPVRTTSVRPASPVRTIPVRNPNTLLLSSSSSLPITSVSDRPVSPRRGLVGTRVPVRSSTLVPVVVVPLSPTRGKPLSPNISRTYGGSY